MNGTFGVTYEQLQPKLSLSAGPSATKHGPNNFFGEADRWRFRAVGAPDTVRCPLLTVGSATRRARITRPTVGRADSWHTGQSSEF
jgi:hypothetical protein